MISSVLAMLGRVHVTYKGGNSRLMRGLCRMVLMLRLCGVIIVKSGKVCLILWC